MNQITPIQLGPRPAHLPSTSDALAINKAAGANWQSGFPVLSIRGRVWHLRQGGREEAITASPGPNMPETPVPWIPVVIVGIATPLAKSYFATGFDEKAMNRRPDCFSINGVTPDAAATNKQNPVCATCRQNQWGTAINSPSGRGKACRDFKRLAVVFANDMDHEMGPMMLQLPPTSVPYLIDYTDKLERLGTAANQVVTMMQFDLDRTAPTVLFQEQAWLTPEQYAKAVELGAMDKVRRMLEQEWGEAPEGEQTPAQAPVQPPVTTLPPRPAHLQAPTPAPAPAPAPTPMVQVAQAAVAAKPRPSPFAQPQPVGAVPLAPVAAPTPAPAPTPQLVQGAPADMQAAIDSLLDK